MRRLIFVVACAMELAACASARRPARESIDAAYRRFEDAFHRGDANAIASIYTDDAEWLVPDAPAIKGRAAIAAAWKQNVGDGGNRLTIEVIEPRYSG